MKIANASTSIPSCDSLKNTIEHKLWSNKNNYPLDISSQFIYNVPDWQSVAFETLRTKCLICLMSSYYLGSAVSSSAYALYAENYAHRFWRAWTSISILRSCMSQFGRNKLTLFPILFESALQDPLVHSLSHLALLLRCCTTAGVARRPG